MKREERWRKEGGADQRKVSSGGGSVTRKEMADATGAAGNRLSRGNEPSVEAGPEVGDDPAVPAAVVTVNIKTLNGPDFELAVERNVLVSDLKAKVRERTDVEEVRQYKAQAFQIFF